jgi:hypothetical protein
MMTISDSSFNFRRTVIAMAVFAFMASAFAQATDEKAKEAAKPEPGEVKTTLSSVTLAWAGSAVAPAIDRFTTSTTHSA